MKVKIAEGGWRDAQKRRLRRSGRAVSRSRCDRALCIRQIVGAYAKLNHGAEIR
jgi:hypothetical protein